MQGHRRSYYSTAYELIADPPAIVAGRRERDWMEATPERFAYRCLPLSIVNQLGWDVLCPASFTARWNGPTSRRSSSGSIATVGATSSAHISVAAC